MHSVKSEVDHRAEPDDDPIPNIYLQARHQ